MNESRKGKILSSMGSRKASHQQPKGTLCHNENTDKIVKRKSNASTRNMIQHSSSSNQQQISKIFKNNQQLSTAIQESVKLN
jgi:hypothetical protein